MVLELIALEDIATTTAAPNDSSRLMPSLTSRGRDLSGTEQGAGGVGGLLAFQDHSSAGRPRYQALRDGNGNVQAFLTLDASPGQPAQSLVGTQDHDPYGNTLTSTLPARFCPIGFSSKYEDDETGLLYYGYRYYSPEMGRWLSKDPIEESGGVNLYGLCGNDGVNRWDYLGLRQMDANATFHVTYANNRIAGTAGAVSTPNPWRITMRVVPVQADHEFGPYKIEFTEAKANCIYYQVETPQDRPHEDRHLQDFKDSWRSLISQANKLDGWTSCCREEAQCWVDVIKLAEQYYFWEAKAKAKKLHVSGGTSPDGQQLGPYPASLIPTEQRHLNAIYNHLMSIKAQMQKKRHECQQKQNTCGR